MMSILWDFLKNGIILDRERFLQWGCPIDTSELWRNGFSWNSMLVIVKAAQDAKTEEAVQVFGGCCFGNLIPMRADNFMWHSKT